MKERLLYKSTFATLTILKLAAGMMFLKILSTSTATLSKRKEIRNVIGLIQKCNFCAQSSDTR